MSTRTQQAYGFTLTELMISIGMILILMTGVTYVFRTTADAVGTGSALSEITRAQRSLHTVLPSDISMFSAISPSLIIDCRKNNDSVVGTPLDETATPEDLRTDLLS